MSILFVKSAMMYAQKKFSADMYECHIKKMADYSLIIAQSIHSNPVICMTASFLHKVADGVTGYFRANNINPILREIGFDDKTLNTILDCINHLLPEYQRLQASNEEKITGDAYILTYWKNFHINFTPHFHFDISGEL